MIISRTPLRISFMGGGSDLPAFYEQRTWLSYQHGDQQVHVHHRQQEGRSLIAAFAPIIQ
jgi:galactokinase/mevalonate kinase-like predicted kinase